MIGRVSLGCALFGGLGSLHELRDRGILRSEAFGLMDAAWDLGIRSFDTADAYGGGTSECWIGEWHRRTRHEIRVTTKTFNAVAPGGDTGLAPDRIRRQVASSLRNLRVDVIDLYLTHEWDPTVPASELVGVLEELVASGQIRSFGLSNVSTDQLRAMLSHASPSTVQNSYSLLLRTDEASLLPTCATSGIAYEAYSPLAGGFLTGKYGTSGAMPQSSRLALVPQWYQHIDAPTAGAAVQQLVTRAHDHGVSAAALSMAWVLQAPGVARMVAGPKRIEHLKQVAAACAFAFLPGEHAEIGSLFTSVQ